MNKTINFDILDVALYAAVPYAGKKELNEYLTATGPEFDAKSQEKIYKRLSKEYNYYSKHKKYSPILEAFKRVAIIILVAMSISFTCVLSIDAAREAIWTAIIEWSENFFYFKYTTENEDAEAPTEILEYKEPMVDERFERYEIRKIPQIYSIEYEFSDKLIIYNQKPLDEYKIYISNFQSDITYISVNGHNGFNHEEDINGEKYFYIIWNDGKYAYFISGNIEYEEILKIAESIK